MKCPRCKHENPLEARFCEECAAPLGCTCPNCGAPLRDTAKFCPACAHPVVPSLGTPQRFGSPESYTPKHLAERILLSKESLAFECALRREDLFGEVLRGVALWCVEPLTTRSVTDGTRALGTEFGGGRGERAAAGTDAFEGRGTFLAELRAWSVIVLTAGALHDGATRVVQGRAAYTFGGLSSRQVDRQLITPSLFQMPRR